MPPQISKGTEKGAPENFIEGYPWYEEKTAPCEPACPAGHRIRRTISLIQENRFEHALENIRGRNPFPGICGRSCAYPCQMKCNRNDYDEGIAISALERAVFDHADMKMVRKPVKREKTGKKVAIIGSGPAGLTGAYFLGLLGHSVTVFEALPVLGGIPRVWIPGYRLPKDVVDREVNHIIGLGIDIRTNTAVGVDIFLEDIMNKYDACLIAIGMHKSMALDIRGEDSEHVISGLDFLKRVTFGDKIDLGMKVAVIGGGNTAIDAARSAKRLGAREVSVIYRRSSQEMPAHRENVEEAEAEGIKILYLTLPIKIERTAKGVSRLECLKTMLGEKDTDGRKYPEKIEGSNFILEVDTIIAALGEALDHSFLSGTDIKGTKGQTIEVDPSTLMAGKKGLFAAGDVATGPSSIAEAIGGGRQAAISIDCYLSGKSRDQIRNIFIDSGGNLIVESSTYKNREGVPQSVVNYDQIINYDEPGPSSYYEHKPRIRVKYSLSPEVKGFEEVKKGYTKGEAIDEASRCFHCGQCFKCGICIDVCPEDVFALTEDGPRVAYPEECFFCGACALDCPCKAISIRVPLPAKVSVLEGGKPLIY